MQGLKVAKALNAHVVAVTVTEPWTAVLSGEDVLAYPELEYDAEMAEWRRTRSLLLQSTQRQLEVGWDTVIVRDQQAADGILATAKDRGCDLIVMASHGRRGLQLLLYGSQTHRVLAQSTLPVLICRQR